MIVSWSIYVCFKPYKLFTLTDEGFAIRRRTDRLGHEKKWTLYDEQQVFMYAQLFNAKVWNMLLFCGLVVDLHIFYFFTCKHNNALVRE